MNTEITNNDIIFIIEEINGRESATVKGVVGDPLSIEIPSQVNVGDSAVPVEKIGKRCFDSKKVESVILPDTLLEIDEAAFMGTPMKDIDLPEGVRSLGVDSFKHCYELERITIPSSLTFIPFRCFIGCHKLKFDRFPLSIIEIDTCGFQGVYFENLRLPSNVKKVGWDAFKMCDLKSIHADEGLEFIGVGTFCNNHDLETVDLPSTVKIMDQGVFKCCESIKKFIIRAKEPPYLEEQYRRRGYFDESVLATMQLLVPKDSIEEYRNHDTWGQIKNISPIVE